MIKKVIINGLIMCSLFFFWGCSVGNDTDLSSADEVQTGNNDINEQYTDNEDLFKEDEQSTEEVEDNVVVSNDGVYEKIGDYKIKKIYAVMVTKVAVNARKGPSEEYGKIKVLEKGQILNVLGQCEETGWYMIKIDNVKAFVSNQFLILKEEGNKLVLGDECPYKMYQIVEKDGQCGWYYRNDQSWQPANYEKILKSIKSDGYSEENFPEYVGTWRDVGDVMWLGYSKK